MKVTVEKALRAIDGEIRAKHLLTHPFYQTWTRGELSRESLSDYAKQYYHHVAAFPTYLSALHAHTEDMEVRKEILKNLVDEEGGSPNHPELWLQFVESLGENAAQAKASIPWDETRRVINTFRRICGQESVAAGMAALYAYESQIPAVAESKIEGLRKFYGIVSPEGYRYFTVHIEADKEHAAVERELLGKLLTEAELDSVGVAVRDTLDALWELLSGVCRRHGIACNIHEDMTR